MADTKRSTSGWVYTQDGHQPRIKVQGGYVGPTGKAPAPPKGGSSFKPTSPTQKTTAKQ